MADFENSPTHNARHVLRKTQSRDRATSPPLNAFPPIAQPVKMTRKEDRTKEKKRKPRGHFFHCASGAVTGEPPIRKPTRSNGAPCVATPKGGRHNKRRVHEPQAARLEFRSTIDVTRAHRFQSFPTRSVTSRRRVSHVKTERHAPRSEHRSRRSLLAPSRRPLCITHGGAFTTATVTVQAKYECRNSDGTSEIRRSQSLCGSEHNAEKKHARASAEILSSNGWMNIG